MDVEDTTDKTDDDTKTEMELSDPSKDRVKRKISYGRGRGRGRRKYALVRKLQDSAATSDTDNSGSPLPPKRKPKNRYVSRYVLFFNFSTTLTDNSTKTVY